MIRQSIFDAVSTAILILNKILPLLARIAKSEAVLAGFGNPAKPY